MTKLRSLLKRPTLRSVVTLIVAGTAMAYQPASARDGSTWTLPYNGTLSSVNTNLFTIINNGTGSNSNAIAGVTAGASSYAIYGKTTSTDVASYPVYGINGGMTAGSQNVGYLAGKYAGIAGVSFSANPNSDSTTACGAFGSATDTSAYGVYGQNNATTGTTGSAVGVYGISKATIGGIGVLGQASSTTSGSPGTGIYGQGGANNYAGYFNGAVYVTGNFSVTGTKSFKIDHPLDPAHKYLVHSCIESDQMMNLYRGAVILNSDGKATVIMPSWFSALNTDFNYQLTCVGGYAPVFVSKEIAHNRFELAGGKPGLKVCWEVTGTRQDAYAKAHPMQVEQTKDKADQGKYLDPADYGKPKTAQIGYVAMPLPPKSPKSVAVANASAHRTR